ncbi:hypothetical protein PN462_21220 [Spirulina sp. CS-785/01]|uniref:hypothetical protein n=1 Tax=Spirulina sp. CS-785/01 TaxID=3021716 RepID=UPI00232F3EDE|nr:hypothetical protein [Spirulina sp. CS-785/01]MDB9315648.1 hypothetical protein [Spirulina sp. CS-785/01]
MSRSQKFLVLNATNVKNPFFIRQEFQKALQKEGLIEEIDLQDDIEIQETGKNATLKKLEITNLNFRDSKSAVEKIWRINLEQEIPGISTKGNTTEVALAVLQRFYLGSYSLNIILIELKSSLQKPKNKKPSTLVDIHNKFKDTMNRMYMLLTLNNHYNPQKQYNEQTIYVKIKGAVVYNKNNISNDDGSELYSVLQNSKKLISCSSILDDKDKIEVKFFPKQSGDDEESRVIALSDLL